MPAGNQPDQPAQNINPHSAAQCGLEPLFFQKAGADHNISLPVCNRFQEPVQIGDIMLPVPVHLHGDIIIILARIDISRLHRTADPHIDREIQIMIIFPPAQVGRIIRGAVVDHEVIIFRRSLHHMLHHMHDVFRFIVCRYDNQHPLTLFHAFLHFLALSRI